ncbi:hypothetical protein ACV22V_31740 [Burkholderia sp. AW33-5]
MSEHESDGGAGRPFTLPPGWIAQPPVAGVSLWTGLGEFILSNQSKEWVRCTVQRARNGQSAVENFTFVVAPEQQSHSVVWLEGPDTGSIQLVDVAPCSVDGPLDGLDRGRAEVFFEQLPPHMLAKIRNAWSVPVYVSVEFHYLNDISLAQMVLVERSQSSSVCDGVNVKPEYRWRSAELQRTSLYGLWPPAL